MKKNFNPMVKIIGNGNVAWHLKRKLKKHITEKFDDADMIIIAIKDSAIAEFVDNMQETKTLVTHTSGITSMDILRKFENYGVIYPLQSLKKEFTVPFSQIPFCIEANNEQNEKKLLGFAQNFTSNVYKINSQQRKVIHLAATFANNFTNHILDCAKQIMKTENLQFEILYPLIKHTINQALKHNPYSIQTGAAARKDFSTISIHESMLSDADRELYSAITKHIITQS